MNRHRARPVLVAVALVATAAVAVRLPFLSLPLSPDEAGFLTIASQWHPGSSLYGAYWVDRPPLLLAYFGLAHWGTQFFPGAHRAALSLRLLGLVVAGLTVILSALLARSTASHQRWAPALTATATAALVSSPLLDMTMVNGELLTLPLTMAGLLALHEAATARRPQAAWLWATTAGLAAMSAPLVKQNAIDVFVAGSLVGLCLVRIDRRRVLMLLGGGVVGAALAFSATMLLAESRGTEPTALWRAVVTFRAQASEVISSQASSATSQRGLHLALVALASGLPALIWLWPRRSERAQTAALSPPVLTSTPVVIAVLAWEIFAVVAGGSYWQHYLMGLVPGCALLMAAACAHLPSWRRPVIAVVPMVLSAAIFVAASAIWPPMPPPQDQAVAGYLRQHAQTGDSGVVAFGDPSLIRAAHLTSPYPDLWSLPVRVHDPRLREFTALLRDREDGPTWVIRVGTSLGSWGLNATAADRVLARHYVPMFTSGDLFVFHRRTA